MKGYYYKAYFDNEKTHWFFNGRRKILSALIDRTCPIGERDKILCIGVGSGAGLETLCGLEHVIGLDRNESALLLAKKNGLRRLILADVTYMPVKAKTMDGVFCFDMLEHINYDNRLIDSIFQICYKGAFLFITVPAFSWLWGPHDLANEHRRRYSKGELKDKLGSAGFEVIRSTYFNMLLSPLIISVRILKRLLSEHRKRERRGPALDIRPIKPNVLNYVLASIFGGERFLLRLFDLPFGISIFCFARKK